MFNYSTCFIYQIQNWNGYNDVEERYAEVGDELGYTDSEPMFPLKGISFDMFPENSEAARWLVAGKLRKKDSTYETFYKKNEEEMTSHLIDHLDAGYAQLKNKGLSVESIFKEAYSHYMGFSNIPLSQIPYAMKSPYLLDLPVVTDFLNECKSVDPEFSRLLKDIVKRNRDILDNFESRLKKVSIVIPHGYQYSQYAKAAKAAEYHLPVFIQGDTGTGKESMALVMHHFSNRKGEFIAINCSAIPENLIESELFGHVKGAFTGALNDKIGKISAANGGTLFLDEIGDVPHSVQTKLLRVLQDMEIEKVGSNKSEKVDVLIVTATNKDVEELLAVGKIREDFYYRVLNYLRIELKPLRDLGADNIIKIAYFILKDIYEKENKRREGLQNTKKGMVESKGMSKQFKLKLCSHSWPGNIRELKNYLHLVAAMSRFEPVLKRQDIPFLRGLNKPQLKTISVDSITNDLTELVVSGRKSLLSIFDELEDKAAYIFINECIKSKAGKKRFAAMIGRHHNDQKINHYWKETKEAKLQARPIKQSPDNQSLGNQEGRNTNSDRSYQNPLKIRTNPEEEVDTLPF
ncbi:MAG: hypothetical protein A2487_13515 [Candidatus Raymondbacteria bacterium RifOxyC12_full_50_8]|uniref:Sigma-54 factor interaction domain-containing protein n=1 Tax=Candidatus Raymondbacteria bacterium RIFOXYD12_FULL_49_13 TaxID=1817890 RepID=A0A1F7F856_UNCRA|nr:MAG: hypothetical protein A2248_13625 [Candidatus Raymondbacteria bacterium RIFOXYA2_FULL_49_16]OGJ95165.1 MAG: hypothetical protein A2350_09480 [Candidatus Raymondbacteria bacterium RifOxyB12_full_50_8]OGK00377.1 MAG: hypothetical protein A2487_13515 [Candidatus Raymondbacteria bacterium RifOxyC12_full_50_8]OGK02707.1 MAG: hypothetical protein A2519_09600 [Candidatus Raymondbacteria bacterium RIFOXYD12_FULL_49_13]OGP42353.1 MAG: hypothetical protein A2324_20270 [Candidatus Raymondbacteria b